MLIVKITEEDLKQQGVWPLPDRTLAQAIQKLTDRGATIIGLDIFRATPVPPGHEDLVKIWDKSEVIVPGCHHRNLKNPGIAGPPAIPAAQLGFVDLTLDRDSVVRRALLFMNRDPQSPCTSEISLSLQVAQEYLLRQYRYAGDFDDRGEFKLHRTPFPRLTGNDGGYQTADDGGYQILLNYRSPDAVAPSVTLGDVLSDRVAPQLIKDRVVFIGSTASSLKDEFLTPYSAGKAEYATMPGVMVHAQITSQILSAVLDGQPLWWFIPEGLEALWIVAWCLGGSAIAWYVRHPLRLFLALGGLGLVAIGCFAIALLNWCWIPLLSPLVGLVGSSIAVLGLTSYRTQQEQKNMAALAATQEQTIDALKLLLLQTAPPVTAIEPPPLAPTAPLPGTTMTPFPGQDLAQTVPYDPQLSPSNTPPGGQLSGYLSPNALLDGRYEVQNVLGSGGFGVTYLARDRKRPGNPPCAIKHLVPARRDPNFVSLARRLFNTEAEILSKLGHHSQIPNILAYFEDNQEFYLVQEFIDGTPLDRELEQSPTAWSEAKVIDFLRQLLPVLDFIHSNYAIHRDLKPGNIIRTERDGKLVLIDFGAVKEINPQLPGEANMTIAIGTRGYTPPEQYAGKPNFSSDIYALGTIAIEAITHTHPRDLPIDDNTGELCWRDRAIVTEKLAAVLDKMVAYHFPHRYQSAQEVLADLLTINN
jgi:CHASE2 domain-containing sensor protein